MKLLVVVALCVVACTAAPARLDNNYLPPGSAGTAGGNGNFLSAPGSSGGHQGGGGGQYHGGASARNPQNDVPILRLDNENNGDGSYRYAYETGNGIQAEEAGQQRQLGTEEVNQVQGSYSYTGDDGQQYTVTYVADENGFQPQGAHLPTPPPIPEAILRSLEQNAAEEARGGGHGDDGQYNEGAHGGQANNGGFNSNSGYRY